MKRKTRLNRDLIFLFSTTSFINGYVTETKTDNYEILNLKNELIRLSSTYRKMLSKIEPKAIQLLDEVDTELQEQASKPKTNRFMNIIDTDDNNDIVADGLFFCLYLLLEFENIKNKRIRLPIKLAAKIEKQKIGFTLEMKNARTIAKHLTNKIMEEYE